jgi:polyhydroxyalkanoate synthesis repressor PhaR
VPSDAQSAAEPVVIKKYANRRLYNTDTSSYVTLDDLAAMVRSDRDFVVYDATAGDDLTHAVLTQIIVEQESRGENLLPIRFLRQIIRFYGDSMGRMVPSYLEFSIDSLTKEQDKYRKQFANAFGANAIEAMQEQTRKNMAIFEQALGIFSPFGAAEKAAGSRTESPELAPDAASASNGEAGGDDLQTLKKELSEMQEKLDQLSRRSS